MSGHLSRLTWCQPEHCLSSRPGREISRWLLDEGSLTARLIEHCQGEFHVRVLSVNRATPTPDEISALAMRPRNQALIRQVLLYCNQQPVVYARTIIPLSSLRGALRGLVHLGTRPLGAVLFADKTMRRRPMEISRLKAGHICHTWTQYKGKADIWGRRSVFVLKNRELLVSEFFLPTLFEQQSKEK